MVFARVSSRGRLGALAAAILVTLLGLNASASGSAPAAARQCAPSRGDAPLNPGSQASVLTGISARTSCDVWAAGYYHRTGERDRTLIEHWNGARWIHFPSPNPGGHKYDNQLHDVAAVSRSNVWAVGEYFRNGSGVDKSVILHWDGSAWRYFPTPHLGHRYDRDWLTAISARSSQDIWAIGRYLVGAGDGPYLLHFNGKTWSHVPPPLIDGVPYEYLTAVAPVSATDVWVVGAMYDYPSGDKTYAARWNGAHWIRTPTPRPGGMSNLYGVTAVGPHNVWAVGRFIPKGDGPERTLALHWNGSAWARVSTPTPGLPQGGGSLASITATRTGSVWALGGRRDSANQQHSYVLHRQAGAWRRIDVADRRGTGGTVLSDLDAAPNDDIWGAGVVVVGSKSRTAAALVHG